MPVTLEPGLEDPGLLFMDGFDDCIAGVVSRFGQPDVVCYDLRKVIDKLEAQGMARHEAHEWFEYNMIGAWVGVTTPCFLEPFNREEIEARLAEQQEAPNE